jgi:hypothetical protein
MVSGGRSRVSIISQGTGEALYLSRPRRFGKTLFVDTLHTFFEGKKELFPAVSCYNSWICY